MQLRMSQRERELFESFVLSSRSYLEFGMGGSTVLAAQTVAGPVYAVESDTAWIDKVRTLIPASSFERKLLFVDIGPTGDWGVPLQPPGEADYLNYHAKVWDRIDREFDFYFIDGRFRVACFCQSLLRAPSGSIVGIHDYRSRPAYHRIEQIARPIAEAEDLTLFVRRNGVEQRDIERLLEAYQWIAH